MIKFIFRIFKRTLFFVFLLYSFNLAASPIGIIIPINFITVGALVILGVPALFSFILLSVLLF